MASSTPKKGLSIKNLIRNPLIVALDVDTDKEALRLAEDLASLAGAFKIGPRLALRYGQNLIEQIAKKAPVFLDNKHFDIPSTMEAAINSSFQAGASLVTIHGLSGREAIQRLSHLEAELNKQRPFKILAVTILTSWEQQSLPRNLQNWEIKKHVQTIVEDTKKAGLTGVVCSAHELEYLDLKEIFVVTPGLQFESKNEDQKRTMTPAEALAKGASALVVGRSIIKSKNPQLATEEILKSLKA